MCKAISFTPNRGEPDYCEHGLDPLSGATPNLACNKQHTSIICDLHVTCNWTLAEALALTSLWSDDGHVDGICLIYEIAEAASPILAPLLLYSAFATRQGKVMAFVTSYFLAQLRWLLKDQQVCSRSCCAMLLSPWLVWPFG